MKDKQEEMLEIDLDFSNRDTAYAAVVYLSMKYKDWSTKWYIYLERQQKQLVKKLQNGQFLSRFRIQPLHKFHDDLPALKVPALERIVLNS